MAPRRRHPLDDQPRPPREHLRLIRIFLAGGGVADGQVELEALLVGAGVELLGPDDGALHVEDAGGGAREGKGLERRGGAEAVLDGGHCVALCCGYSTIVRS